MFGGTNNNRVCCIRIINTHTHTFTGTAGSCIDMFGASKWLKHQKSAHAHTHTLVTFLFQAHKVIHIHTNIHTCRAGERKSVILIESYSFNLSTTTRSSQIFFCYNSTFVPSNSLSLYSVWIFLLLLFTHFDAISSLKLLQSSAILCIIGITLQIVSRTNTENKYTYREQKFRENKFEKNKYLERKKNQNKQTFRKFEITQLYINIRLIKYDSCWSFEKKIVLDFWFS